MQLGLRTLGVAATTASGVAALAWAGAVGVVLAALAAVLLLAQGAALVRYAERPTRELARFLEALRYEDFGVRAAGRGRGVLFDAVAEGFDEVAGALRRARAEREAQAQMLQAVVRRVPTGLLAYREGGQVVLLNPAARRLLGLPRVRDLARLATVQPGLAQALAETPPGARRLVRVEREGGTLDLVLRVSAFWLAGVPHTLVSLQDIRAELETRELEAWQQLTRVLTHEIANSVTPIASLAATVSEHLRGHDGPVREALATIERRSQGLVRFVEAYRRLTRVPAPVPGRVAASDVLGGVCLLLGEAARRQGVSVEVEVLPANLALVADPELLEQALLNLGVNALEAVAGRPDACVRLTARREPTGHVTFEVADNGPGIEPEARERIFVPFFTTKTGGTGIGLALARQIARLHGGTLTVRTAPGEGATFAIRL